MLSWEKKQLKSFESFVDNMFDDSSKHESLQMKMGKIALGVHKKSQKVTQCGSKRRTWYVPSDHWDLCENSKLYFSLTRVGWSR